MAAPLQSLPDDGRPWILVAVAFGGTVRVRSLSGVLRIFSAPQGDRRISGRQQSRRQNLRHTRRVLGRLVASGGNHLGVAFAFWALAAVVLDAWLCMVLAELRQSRF